MYDVSIGERWHTFIVFTILLYTCANVICIKFLLTYLLTYFFVVNFGLLFREQIFSTRDISHTFYQSATKFGSARGLANRHLLLEFGERWHTFIVFTILLYTCANLSLIHI